MSCTENYVVTCVHDLIASFRSESALNPHLTLLTITLLIAQPVCKAVIFSGTG